MRFDKSATRALRRSWTRRGPILAAVALASGVAAGCGSESPSPRVLARWDAATPGTPAQRVVAGRVARPGLCAAPPHRVSLPIPAGARQLQLAVTRRRPAEASLAVTVGTSTEPLLLAQDAPRAGWREHSLALPAPPASDAATLHLAWQGAPEARLCVGSLRFEGLEADASRPPHVLVLLLDTLSAHDLGLHAGRDGVSPNIDAFVAGAFHLERAYAQFPSTFVSHSSLFSGLHPVRHGRYNRPDPRYGPGRPPLRSLVAEFARAGYVTRAFTENAYVGSSYGFDAGFDAYDDSHAAGFEIRSGDSARTFAKAATWIAEHADGPPFFLFVHTYEVHSPYEPVDDEAMAFANQATPGDTRLFESQRFHANVARQNHGENVFSPRDFRRLRALYSGEIQYLDRRVAAFLDALRDADVADRTLLVLTSDHGEQFGEGGRLLHGVGLHDRVMHVPLAIRGPGVVQGRYAPPVQLVDVLPTLLELAQLPVPPDLDGRSLAPMLRGEGAPPEARPAFAEERRRRLACDRPQDPACFVRRDVVWSGNFKYVEGRDGRDGQLFDLASDPDERHDLARRDLPRVLELRTLLEDYRGRPPAVAPADTTTPEVDAETRRALEALGYVP